MTTFEIGDVVQLRSGGAPFTIVGGGSWGFELTCISTGGLVQQAIAPAMALKHYHGELTKAYR